MSNKMAPDLGKLDELAKVHALSYASPHHFTMSVNGLREVIAELQLPAGNKMALDALTEPKAVSLTDVLQAAAPAEIADALAPVVQAVQAVELIEQEMAMLIRRLCSTTANDKTRAQAMEYLFKRGHASPLRAESEPAQAMDHPPLPEGVKARFKCEDCDGTGYTGDMIPGSEFQPPEPVGCTSCRFTGWWAECEAYSADQMHAYLDADRASSGAAQAAPRCVTCDGTGEVHRADGTWVGTCFCAEGKRAATTQAVRMLTREELNDVALSEQVGWEPGEYVEAVQRKFAKVNGLRIPADGKIGSAA